MEETKRHYNYNGVDHEVALKYDNEHGIFVYDINIEHFDKVRMYFDKGSIDNLLNMYKEVSK